ncbi:MAG: Svx/AvrXca family virulence/avirulence protein [Sphingomonas phyllosphaerae]|uniref:Svx/AvrXca family virulence/avirulence protein n=1 Tax=Sphingomonas phyllosphaerae TaxID=257003 RepID=UPI002FFC4787
MRHMTILLAGAALALSGCGGGEGSQAQASTSAAPTPAASTNGTACVAGTWKTPATTLHPNIRYESDHFAFRWVGDPTTVDKAKQAASFLEGVYAFYASTGLPEPFCASPDKAKINVVISTDAVVETGGGDDQGLPLIRFNAPTLDEKQVMAHELTHVFQQFSGHMAATPYTYWFWESHANWMSSQVPELRGDVNCGDQLTQTAHLSLGSARTRYCTWQIWEYLKDRYGYAAVQDIWRKAPKIGEAGQATADPFSVLMSNLGWSVSQLNDEIGNWALHNVTWDYTNPDGSDQGAVYRANFGPYTSQFGNGPRRIVEMLPIDLPNRRFAVPAAWAPQRFGYNVIRLAPDEGATSVTVAFRSVTQTAPATTRFPGLPNEPATIPAPASGWRWSIVVVDRNGKPRYGALQRGGDEQLTVALQPGDQGVYVVVAGTPTEYQKIVFNQPYYSIYRYPYMIQLTGALPWGFQPGAPTPTYKGHAHPNGGGWVADGAEVDASAYVGPYAKVIGGKVQGNARLEDNAILLSGTVSGNAVLAGLATVDGGTFSDSARADTWYGVIGGFGPVTLSGTAQLRGDFTQSDAGYSGNLAFTASKGVFFGPNRPGDASAANKGANLTEAPAEVTATPNYVWR